MANKRSHGEGHVKQLPSGNWRGQVMAGYTDDGKKKVISFSGGTKSEVLAKIRDFQYQKEQGISLDNKLIFEN